MLSDAVSTFSVLIVLATHPLAAKCLTCLSRFVKLLHIGGFFRLPLTKALNWVSYLAGRQRKAEVHSPA